MVFILGYTYIYIHFINKGCHFSSGILAVSLIPVVGVILLVVINFSLF